MAGIDATAEAGLHDQRIKDWQRTAGGLTMSFEHKSGRHFFRLIRAAAIATVGAGFAEAAVAQQWNEIPAPTGKEAVSRTYPAGYRTDVVDVRVRGDGGEVEYMIQMK